MIFHTVNDGLCNVCIFNRKHRMMILLLINIHSTPILSLEQDLQVMLCLVLPYMLILPFTGHGFKLAPVIGKILTEMIMELPLSYDITRFSLKRFSS